MTTRPVKLKLLPRSTIKAKSVTRLVGQVEAGDGITVVKSGGVFTVSVDIPGLGLDNFQPIDADLTELSNGGTAGYAWIGNGVGVTADFQGFTATASGAVARTWKSKFEDTISVKDFGAVGDGATNDTAAFQAALDHDLTANCGIFVPSGTYRVGQLTTYPNTRIYGASQTETIIEAIDSLNVDLITVPKSSSSSSVLIGTGSKTFTVTAGLYFPVGGYVQIINTATITNYMQGEITAYSGTSLTVNVDGTGGAGTLNSWLIILACDDAEIDGLTIDARRNRSGVASSNTVGDALVMAGWRIAVRDVDILHAPETGLKTWAANPLTRYDRGVEGEFTNVRIDNPGTNGWYFFGPNDSAISNVRVIDASAGTDNTGYGIYQDLFGSGKFNNCHVWNWSSTTNVPIAAWLINTSGNEYTCCHIESGRTACRVIAASQQFSTCRFYAPDGANNAICLDLQAGYNTLTGCIIGPGVTYTTYGIRIGSTASGQSSSYNIIDVESVECDLGVINFDNNAGFNRIIVRGSNSAGVASAGSPATTDTISLSVSGAGGGVLDRIALAEGGIIRWDGSDATITQTGTQLSIASATLIHTLSQNGLTAFSVTNTNAGASATAVSQMISDAGTFLLDATSTAGGAFGIQQWTGAGGLLIQSKNATGTLTFQTGSTPTTGLTISAAQVVDVPTSLSVLGFVVTGAWTAFTATATAGTGTITSQTSDSAYIKIGKMIFVNLTVTITNVGTGSGTLTISGLPVAAKRNVFIDGRESITSGKMICHVVGAAATSGFVFNYDNTNPAMATGSVYIINGVYEAQ